MKQIDIHTFVTDQLSTWPLAEGNFKAIESVHVREVEVNGLTIKLQFNPARMISSAAKLSKEDIARRKCFLCRENRPSVQTNIPYVTPDNHEYHVLVNPYPIFPDHLVVAMAAHTDQGISGRYEDMLFFAREFQGYTLFYNGPKCGASAPDHHHFQVAPRGLMPLEMSVEDSFRSCQAKNLLSKVSTFNDAAIYHYDNFSHGIFVITSPSVEGASYLFERLMASAEIPEGDIEPRMNLSAGGQVSSIVQ